MKYGFETAINQEKEAVQVEKNTLSNFEWQGVIVARGKAKDKLKLLSQLIPKSYSRNLDVVGTEAVLLPVTEVRFPKRN